MHKFVDEISIYLKAGNGGAGCISFRREKFIPLGGPDGGDGGKGGNVYFCADPRIINLSHLQKDREYKAENGKPGEGRKKSGRKGENLTIKVPLGTVLIDEDNNEFHDFSDTNAFLFLEGARGGRGNTHFKSSKFQAPRFSQPGEATEQVKIKISLKTIADVGLVGLPNAGKSTLLKKLTSADPKIGDYPFTTLTPNLGSLELSPDKHCVIADIPGIIEGASRGQGLGLSFLKHIERVKLIVFILDVSTADVEAELKVLKQELEEYNPVLNRRPMLIVFNKSDLIEEEFLLEWLDSFKKEGFAPIAISALNDSNLSELKQSILKNLFK